MKRYGFLVKSRKLKGFKRLVEIGAKNEEEAKAQFLRLYNNHLGLSCAESFQELEERGIVEFLGERLR